MNKQKNRLSYKQIKNSHINPKLMNTMNGFGNTRKN